MHNCHICVVPKPMRLILDACAHAPYVSLYHKPVHALQLILQYTDMSTRPYAHVPVRPTLGFESPPPQAFRDKMKRKLEVKLYP